MTITEQSTKNIDNKEIELHIAEYEVLINRATYYINIQFILLSALIAWIVVIGQIWKPDLECLLNWALIIGALIIGIINAIMLWENYCIISYVETELKPKIHKIINKKTFWGYEAFLSKLREPKTVKYTMRFMDFIGSIISILIILATIIYRFHQWEIGDWLGLISSLLLLIALSLKTYQAMKLRENSFKFDLDENSNTSLE